MLKHSFRTLCSVSPVKGTRRCLSTSARRFSPADHEDVEKFTPKLTEAITFPSFSTSGKFGSDFVYRVKLPHVFEFVGYGQCHKLEFAHEYLKKTGQSGAEVYEGTKFAVEEVTKLMATFGPENESKLRDCVTNACFMSLKRTLENDERFQDFQKKNLLSMPQGDMVFSWLHELKVVGEGYECLLCTISHPGYQRILNIVLRQREREKVFQEQLKKRVAEEKLQVADIKRAVAEFKSAQIDVGPEYAYKPIVVSNFRFVRGEGANSPWLLDEVKMMHAADIFSKYQFFRWRGRIGVSLKGPGITVGQAIRYDWFTDYCVAVLFVMTWVAYALQKK